jgi:hypothetical protein
MAYFSANKIKLNNKCACFLQKLSSSTNPDLVRDLYVKPDYADPD